MSLLEYMSFDVSWFTTTEGLLITIGVVVALIGMIGFIVCGKKSSPETVDVKNDENKDDKPLPQVEPTVVNSEAPKVEEVKTESNEAPLNVPTENVAVKEEPVVTNVNPVEAPTPSVNDVESVSTPSVTDQPANPVGPSEEVILEPAKAVEMPVANETNQNNQVNQTNQTVAQPSEPVVNPTPTVAIYGGANPQVSVAPVEEPRQVYGGANPLENTGALPRVQTMAPIETLVIDEPVREEKVEVKPVEAVEQPVAPSSVTVVQPNVNPQVVEPVLTATPKTDVETLEF